MSASNVEIALRGFDAALRGEFEPIAALLDPDVKWHAGDPNAEARAGTARRRSSSCVGRGHGEKSES